MAIVQVAMHASATGINQVVQVSGLSSCVPVFVVRVTTKAYFVAHLGGSQNKEDFCFQHQALNLSVFIDETPDDERLLFVTFRFRGMEKDRKWVVRYFERKLRKKNIVVMRTIDTCHSVTIDLPKWEVQTQAIAGADITTVRLSEIVRVQSSPVRHLP